MKLNALIVDVRRVCWWLVAMGCVLALSACALPGVAPERLQSSHLERSDQAGECARLFAELDAQVVAHGVADAQAQRIPGYPYLRVSRLLAALPVDARDHAAFEAWMDQLQTLDRDARGHENRNLVGTEFKLPGEEALQTCRQVLRKLDTHTLAGREQLLRDAVARSSYNGTARVFGLYPVTAFPMRLGVSRLHADTDARFQLSPAERLPVGELVRYGPAPATSSLAPHEVAAMLADAADNALRLPLPDPAIAAQLLQTFAPAFEVDVVSNDDRLGSPTLHEGDLRIDTARPSVYTLLSHTSIDGELLLQLNYVVWFPARTRANRFDLLAGPVDGVTWRVTLAKDGRPLFYDAMHNCGCYYMAFPTGVFEPRPGGDFEEPVLVPLTLPREPQRWAIRIAPGTHYLEQVRADATIPVPDREYALRSYAELRSLPTPTGFRSLFAADGIVKGSERAERWLFWPMGVPEPGAMRQWGNHAIAFVGRRHFDDPDLIERYFRRRED